MGSGVLVVSAEGRSRAAMLGSLVLAVGLGEALQRKLGELGIHRLVIVLGFIGAALSLWTGLRLLLG